MQNFKISGPRTDVMGNLGWEYTFTGTDLNGDLWTDRFQVVWNAHNGSFLGWHLFLGKWSRNRVPLEQFSFWTAKAARQAVKAYMDYLNAPSAETPEESDANGQACLRDLDGISLASWKGRKGRHRK